LIGAVALAARGISRASADVDVFTLASICLDPNFWAPLRDAGLTVDVRVGDDGDPLAGVVRVDAGSDEPVDIVVGRSPRWQAGILERSRGAAVVDGVTIPVPEAAYLVLLKLYAGGPRDRDDIRSLLFLPRSADWIPNVEARLPTLPKRCHELWSRIRTEGV
jgi:hypothetical protein